MGRRTAEEFSGTPLGLVYIAGNTADAKKAEGTLTEHGIDYAVSLESFTNSSAVGTVVGGTYAGVFFFVPAAQHGSCQDLLEAGGLVDTIPLDVSLEKIDGA